MRFLRWLSIVLVMLVGAGSALLDSCVFGCRSHVHASAPETPPCHAEGQHDAATSSGVDRWTATAACAHDHAAATAGVVSPSRSGRTDAAPGLFLAPALAISAAVPAIASRAAFDPVTSNSTRSAAFLSPLRL